MMPHCLVSCKGWRRPCRYHGFPPMIWKSTEACTVSPTTQLPTAPKAPGWLIAASLLAVYIIWGTTYFAIKVGIEGAAPFFLVGTRFLVAGGLLLGWQAIRGQP